MARKFNYLSNKNLLVQFALSNEQGKMTDELAKMCMLLVKNYAKKPNFANYTFREDFESYALLMLVRTWKAFDVTRSEQPNPFAFLTQCVKNSFRQYLNKEKDQRDVRDALLVESGLNPSYSYMEQPNEVENVRSLDF